MLWLVCGATRHSSALHRRYFRDIKGETFTSIPFLGNSRHRSKDGETPCTLDRCAIFETRRRGDKVCLMCIGVVIHLACISICILSSSPYAFPIQNNPLALA